MHLDTISFLDFYENNYPILLTRHNEKSRFLDYPSRGEFIYNDWILRILQEDIENFARDFIKYTVKCFISVGIICRRGGAQTCGRK